MNEYKKGDRVMVFYNDKYFTGIILDIGHYECSFKGDNGEIYVLCIHSIICHAIEEICTRPLGLKESNNFCKAYVDRQASKNKELIEKETDMTTITATIYKNGLLIFPPVLAKTFNLTEPGNLSVTLENNVISCSFKHVNLNGDILRYGLDRYKKISILIKRLLNQNGITPTGIMKYNVVYDTTHMECRIDLNEQLDTGSKPVSKETLIENLEEDLEELKLEKKDTVKPVPIQEIGTFKQVILKQLVKEPILTVEGNGYFKFNSLATEYILDKFRAVNVFYDKENKRMGFKFISRSESTPESYILYKQGYDKKFQRHLEISFQANRIMNKYFKFKNSEKFKYSLYYNKELDICWIQLGKETEKINVEKEISDIKTHLFELNERLNYIPIKSNFYTIEIAKACQNKTILITCAQNVESLKSICHILERCDTVMNYIITLDNLKLDPVKDFNFKEGFHKKWVTEFSSEIFLNFIIK